MAAQPVERADRGLRVRHADVDVHPGDGRGRGVAEQVADAPVARLRGDPGSPLAVARLQAAADRRGAGRHDRGAQLPEHAHRLGDGPDDRRGDLHLARVQLRRRVAGQAVRQALEDLLPRLRRAAVARVDEEQLLLDAERERIPLAELVLAHASRSRRRRTIRSASGTCSASTIAA